MNANVIDQKEIYREVNSVTGPVNSVIFGTEGLAELPVAELVQNFGLNISVCNRSVEEAVLADAFDLLDECVYELKPAKVFLNFGDTDLMRNDFSRDAFLSDYHRLIEAIRSHIKCSIFVVSVLSGDAQAQDLNAALKEMADHDGCGYVNAESALSHEKPHLRLFSELIHYMREGRISFSDAMHYCNA